jgi:hypothetical protein
MTGGALFRSSGNLIADRRYQWALDHAARGELAAAADILAQTVELGLGFATVWFVPRSISGLPCRTLSRASGLGSKRRREQSTSHKDAI